MLFLDFWEPGDISDQDGYHKILKFLDFMTGLGIGASSGLKYITSDKVAQWDFEIFCVTFFLPKITVVDADGIFSGMFKNTFQEALLILVQAVSRGDHKAIINEGFHCYLIKFHKIHSADKGDLNQWLQGVFFTLYACNAVPVYGTDIS